MLSGPAFSLSYSVMGIFGGAISDKVNRKWLACIMCICWSITTLLTGIIDGFAEMVLFRVLLGIFEAPFNPCAYGIISDYFHPSNRGLANAIFNLAIYFGGALSSMAILMITETGWRNTFNIIGSIGIFAGLLGLFIIAEPVRGTYEDKEEVKEQPVQDQENKGICSNFMQAALEILVNPTSRWVTIAASLRFFAGYAIGFYIAAFYQGVWNTDEFKNEFAIWNAVIHAVCGFVSAVGGGYIGDKFEKKGYFMAKAWVCVIGSGLGAPLFFMCTYYNKPD